MARQTKRQKAIGGLVEANKTYPLMDALALVKKGATAKFDESVDVAVNLGGERLITLGYFSHVIRPPR